MMIRAYLYSLLGDYHLKRAKKFPRNSLGELLRYGEARYYYNKSTKIAKKKLEKLKAKRSKWVK